VKNLIQIVNKKVLRGQDFELSNVRGICKTIIHSSSTVPVKNPFFYVLEYADYL